MTVYRGSLGLLAPNRTLVCGRFGRGAFGANGSFAWTGIGPGSADEITITSNSKDGYNHELVATADGGATATCTFDVDGAGKDLIISFSGGAGALLENGNSWVATLAVDDTAAVAAGSEVVSIDSTNKRVVILVNATSTIAQMVAAANTQTDGTTTITASTSNGTAEVLAADIFDQAFSGGKAAQWAAQSGDTALTITLHYTSGTTTMTQAISTINGVTSAWGTAALTAGTAGNALQAGDAIVSPAGAVTGEATYTAVAGTSVGVGSGPGWSVAQTAIGTYTITFNRKYPQLDCCIATIDDSAGNSLFCQVGPYTASAGTLVIYTISEATGALADAGAAATDQIGFMAIFKNHQ